MKVLELNKYKDVHYWKLGRSFLGKPRLFVYVFLVDGLLIDTAFPRIGKDLSRILKDEVIQKIVVTHHHEDHAGNVEMLKKTLGAKAYGSLRCVELMKNPMRVEPARWMTWGQPSKAEIMPLNISEPIRTENFTFEIIEAPGHAEDQICLFEKQKGWLFSADCYLDDHIQVFMRDEKILQHIKTIKKLIQLEFEVLFCSHNVQIKNGKQRLKNKLQFLEDFYGRVEQEYFNGLNEKEIMSKLGIKEYSFIKALSMGQLSRQNMIRSTLKAIQLKKS